MARSASSTRTNEPSVVVAARRSARKWGRPRRLLQLVDPWAEILEERGQEARPVDGSPTQLTERCRNGQTGVVDDLVVVRRPVAIDADADHDGRTVTLGLPPWQRHRREVTGGSVTGGGRIGFGQDPGHFAPVRSHQVVRPLDAEDDIGCGSRRVPRPRARPRQAPAAAVVGGKRGPEQHRRQEVGTRGARSSSAPVARDRRSGSRPRPPPPRGLRCAPRRAGSGSSSRWSRSAGRR